MAGMLAPSSRSSSTSSLRSVPAGLREAAEHPADQLHRSRSILVGQDVAATRGRSAGPDAGSPPCAPAARGRRRSRPAPGKGRRGPRGCGLPPRARPAVSRRRPSRGPEGCQRAPCRLTIRPSRIAWPITGPSHITTLRGLRVGGCPLSVCRGDTRSAESKTVRPAGPSPASPPTTDLAAGRQGGQRVTITEEPWPKRPWLAVTATRAPSTWRPAARPRSCQTASHTWAMAWAGMASPKHDEARRSG